MASSTRTTKEYVQWNSQTKALMLVTHNIVAPHKGRRCIRAVDLAGCDAVRRFAAWCVRRD
ncbi:MAG: hypothetical protein ACYTFA_12150 [Planctomycetota bacterium]